MKRPWMPLYIGDFLTDTTHLMATETGAYLLLLMHYWTNGPIPDDNARLCRIAKIHPPHWKRIRAALEPFFDLTKRPGLWSHHRADQELTKADEISSKRKKAAMQMHSKSSANAEQMHTQSQSQSKKEEEAASNVPLKAPSFKVSKKGNQLPADWRPAERHYAEAAALNLPRATVDREAQNMRLWAVANANRAVARKANWDATFSNWLRRKADDGQKKQEINWNSGIEGVI